MRMFSYTEKGQETYINLDKLVSLVKRYCDNGKVLLLIHLTHDTHHLEFNSANECDQFVNFMLDVCKIELAK